MDCLSTAAAALGVLAAALLAIGAAFFCCFSWTLYKIARRHDD